MRPSHCLIVLQLCNLNGWLSFQDPKAIKQHGPCTKCSIAGRSHHRQASPSTQGRLELYFAIAFLLICHDVMFMNFSHINLPRLCLMPTTPMYGNKVESRHTGQAMSSEQTYLSSSKPTCPPVDSNQICSKPPMNISHTHSSLVSSQLN